MAYSIRNITDWIIGAFSSLKLAVTLLIMLALVSILGTLMPQERDPSVYIGRFGPDGYSWLKNLGLIDLYHSWGFRFLMGLVTLNLLVCTLRRLKGIYRRTLSPVTEKSAGEIGRLKLHTELPSPENAPVIERALADKGFKVVKRGRFIYGGKGIMGIWGDMITHLSILLIITGALLGSTGFVSTVNVYVNGWTDVAYNWSTGKDEPLGFRLGVNNFLIKYYPVRMKLTVWRISTGNKVAGVEAVEGASTPVPATGLSVTPVKVDINRNEAVLKIYQDNRLYGVYDTGLPTGGPAAPVGMDYLFQLDSYSSPKPMSISSTVDISRGGTDLMRGVVAVNQPLKFEGLSIYQTSHGSDPEGKAYTGYQIVRDPGLPLVWAGFVLLLAGLSISFYFSHRQVWAYVGEQSVTIGGSTTKDWGGFMTEYGGVIKTYMQEVKH
jgi:cytochrome c biogenesis protein